MASVTAVGIVIAAAVVAAAVILVLTRRSHLRSWRFGLFYESEDTYGDPPSPGSGSPKDD